MTASRRTPPAPRIPTNLGTRSAAADRARTELRRMLLCRLAFDVHPSRLAKVVASLCAAIEPMLVFPTVLLGDKANLSDREVLILVGMAAGLSNAQIGGELHLSEDTVKTYTRRLFTVLGVRNRAHAVARAFQRGILLVGEPGDRDESPAADRRSPVVPAALHHRPSCRLPYLSGLLWPAHACRVPELGHGGSTSGFRPRVRTG